MKDQHSVISEGIKVTGNIEASEDLLINGRVDGDIKSSQTVLIEVTGIVKGHVRAQTVIVRGVMVGDLHTKNITQLTAEGRMVGNIFSPKVLLDEGAAFRGRIDMGERSSAGEKPHEEKKERFGGSSSSSNSGFGSRSSSTSSTPSWNAQPTERTEPVENSSVVKISEEPVAQTERRRKKKKAK